MVMIVLLEYIDAAFSGLHGIRAAIAGRYIASFPDWLFKVWGGFIPVSLCVYEVYKILSVSCRGFGC